MPPLVLIDFLVQHEYLKRTQVNSLNIPQSMSNMGQVNFLIDKGVLTEARLAEFFNEKMNAPYFNLKEYHLVSHIAQKLTESFARKHRVIVLKQADKFYSIGMADPLNQEVRDEIEKILKAPCKVFWVKERDLLPWLDKIYQSSDAISQFAQKVHEEISADTVVDLEKQEDYSSSPVAQLLQSILDDAVKIGASDIHVEPGENELTIRLRVGGVLQERKIAEHKIADALVSRLKLISNLNISEKRLPQDGRFFVKANLRPIDLRLSSMPTQHGESVVMRILDQSNSNTTLNDAGLSSEHLAQFRRWLQAPNGIILVTGPTGSGKTTTLYAGLSEINVPEVKIITIEDPVEYRLPRINQVQVNSKIGLTFSSVLRAVLRQDPDIIMLGEMRDLETAEVAIRAALTGHLVLSTLHTNDAASSIIRLIDMGIKGYLLAETIQGIVAQRLVRKICAHCRVPQELTDAEKIHWYGADYLSKQIPTFYVGNGCVDCNHSGYRGRVGVHELFELTPAMKAALQANDILKFKKIAQETQKGRLLADNGLKLAEQGLTTLTEILRVAATDDDHAEL